MPLLETPGHLQASLGQSLVGSLLLYPGSWCTRFCLGPPRVYFPVLCKFWQLSGGINGNLLQEGLCHTQVCCTQSSCPCGSPLVTHTSTKNAQTQFCLSLCGVPGSWCAQGLFEPSECLAGMGFDSKGEFTPPTVLLGLLLWPLRVSPHSCSNTYRLTGVSLTLDVGYHLSASPLQRHAAAAYQAAATRCSSATQPPLAAPMPHSCFQEVILK